LANIQKEYESKLFNERENHLDCGVHFDRLTVQEQGLPDVAADLDSRDFSFERRLRSRPLRFWKIGSPWADWLGQEDSDRARSRAQITRHLRRLRI
jgi:hypothetical protein